MEGATYLLGNVYNCTERSQADGASLNTIIITYSPLRKSNSNATANVEKGRGEKRSWIRRR